MLNLLVETKNEYTTHLSNILTPLIFEGFQTIYKESMQIAGANDILKLFQSFLKRIPKWNQSMIETETERIINSSHSYGWLNDLIRATIKANIVILMYNPTLKNQVKVSREHYQNIKTTDFIHKVYVECARELWNNPYLLYHNYPPIEIKRNQRDCMNIIKECIKEAIRKLLPVKHILQIYLGEDIETNNNDNDFEKNISEVDEKNLTKLIRKDLQDDVIPPEINNTDNFSSANSDKKIIEYKGDSETSDAKDTKDAKDAKDTTDKTIGSRILGIINENGSTTSSDNQLTRNNSPTISDLEESIKKFEKSIKPINEHASVMGSSVDDKIKKILEKDLADSDIETSLNYSQEDNDNKYQEIFSNSNISNKQNNIEKTNKDKKKFFSNYMQF
jgi:hypothetical protein